MYSGLAVSLVVVVGCHSDGWLMSDDDGTRTLGLGDKRRLGGCIYMGALCGGKLEGRSSEQLRARALLRDHVEKQAMRAKWPCLHVPGTED